MFEIDIKTIQKISDINQMLNSLEVKGMGNISILYNCMATLQGILSGFQRQIDIQNNGVSIDNTKEKK